MWPPSHAKEELREAMTRYGQTFSAAECDEMFRDADANGDGSIDFDEFLGMMMEDQVSLSSSYFLTVNSNLLAGQRELPATLARLRNQVSRARRKSIIKTAFGIEIV